MRRNICLQQDHPSLNVYFDKGAEAAFPYHCCDAVCASPFIKASGKCKGASEKQMDLGFKAEACKVWIDMI